jgi:hypothetical protein
MNRTKLCQQKHLAFATLLLSGLILGCSAAPQSSPLYVSDTAYLQTWYPFLQVGKTTKAEVESELGKASQQFENGRLWTYQLIGGQKVYENPQYSLVLVFDDKDILSQHRLIRLRHGRM